MKTGRVFEGIPETFSEERFETLFSGTGGFRLERIVSKGHASPPDFWYDQDAAEWVILLQGSARVVFEDRTVELAAGDYLEIPAHCRHRVAWTSAAPPAVWLAVHASA